jgi:hypothetical protein
MNVLRRCGAALLLVFGALGVALCLGALVGVWVVHQPAADAISSTLDTLDGYLTLANQTVEQISDTTTRLQLLTEVAGPELDDEDRGAIAVRASVAVQEATSTLTRLRNTVQDWSNSVGTWNRTLAGLERLPGLVPPSVSDALQGIEGSLSAISARMGTLELALSGASRGLTRVSEVLSAISGELQALNDQLDQWALRLTTARAAIASAKATAATVLILTSVGLSLLLVLFGVGQANLCIQAWRWLRAPSVQGG